MRQHHAHYHRKRMMMQKYAQAKKLYAEHNQYPRPQPERYGGPHMMDYPGFSYFFVCSDNLLIFASNYYSRGARDRY